MTSGGNSFNYFTGNQLTKFICRMYKKIITVKLTSALMYTNYTSQSFHLNSVVLSDISKFSTVTEQQLLSVGSRRPQPLGALRRLPHLAYCSYATASSKKRFVTGSVLQNPQSPYNTKIITNDLHNNRYV